MSESRNPRNRLADAVSPYLRQHAANPVDWYPWGPDALEKARTEDKPIFLSIGYSACHWCHVMAHESFEDNAVADLLNAHFVSIKVDREERPDLDDIYMSAVQLVTGTGGWPMTVFLTPDLRPFFCGTYFPKDDQVLYNRPGFKSILRSIAQYWDQERGKVDQSAAQITELVQRNAAAAAGQPGTLPPDILDRAVDAMAQAFDRVHGGFGGAPKFPPAPSLAFLLRRHAATDAAEPLDMAVATLRHMAWGGIYDHVGGGFHRYAVDAEWLVPHFEKMLYDNGQLAEVYLEAYQATGTAQFRDVATGIFAYQLRDMTSPEGAFYASEDADSEGEEGRFYLWTHDELEAVLGPEDARLVAAHYNVRPEGNFSSHEPYHAGQNVLHVTRPIEATAQAQGMAPEALDARLDAACTALREARARRVRPGCDDKILTAWNALMITALAKGAQVLGEARWSEAAERAARFIQDHMVLDGRLMRVYGGGHAQQPGYLDDYANWTVALLDLYEATFDGHWFDAAKTWAGRLLEHFADADGGGFFFTAHDHETLIARLKPAYDGSEPSGNSMAALALLRLGRMTGERRWTAAAEGILESNAAHLSQAPRAFGKLLCALDFHSGGTREIALAGPQDSAAMQAMVRALHRRFRPNKVVAHYDPKAPDADALATAIPLLAGKAAVNGAAAYVCQDFACQQPARTPEAFEAALDA